MAVTVQQHSYIVWWPEVVRLIMLAVDFSEMCFNKCSLLWKVNSTNHQTQSKLIATLTSNIQLQAEHVSTVVNRHAWSQYNEGSLKKLLAMTSINVRRSIFGYIIQIDDTGVLLSFLIESKRIMLLDLLRNISMHDRNFC